MTSLSVIIPVFNRSDLILRSVGSVLAQTMPDVQVVVVDNGSTDDTAAVVEALGEPNITVVRLDSNRGAAGGRNAGLEVARGEYVGFLDSDDELDSRWAELLMAAAADGSLLATCGFVMMNSDSGVRYEHISEPLGAGFSHLVGPFQAGTFIVQRKLLLDLGGYVDALRYSENTELGLRLGAHCAEFKLITSSVDQPLMRWHHNSSHVYDVPERRASCAYLLEHHCELLKRDPRMLSSYRSQLAVWDARAGDLHSARQNFWSAWRARPNGVRNLARLAVAAIPPIARRTWPQSVGSAR